jgi:drug/metabolite transporter (DMT)-like permease
MIGLGGRVAENAGSNGQLDRRTDPMLVILLVLAAAAVGALGLVLLRKATQAEPERPQFSLKLIWLLIRRRPVWAGGIVTLTASFVLQAIALASGPVSQVQLVIVMELPFSLIRRWIGDRGPRSPAVPLRRLPAGLHRCELCVAAALGVLPRAGSRL